MNNGLHRANNGLRTVNVDGSYVMSNHMRICRDELISLRGTNSNHMYDNGEGRKRAKHSSWQLGDKSLPATAITDIDNDDQC